MNDKWKKINKEKEEKYEKVSEGNWRENENEK